MYLRALLLVVLISCPTLGMTQAYKWVDENGVVSYSQTPPRSLQGQRVDLKPTPSVSTKESNDELKRLRQRLQDSRNDRELAQQTEREARDEAARKGWNCTAARSNLQKLLNLGNRMLKTANGNYLRLSENERQQRMQTARWQIASNCNSYEAPR
jgi:hypothetical protein